MDRLSRWWFTATGSILVLLATGLVVTGVYQVAAALLMARGLLAQRLLTGVGYVVIAVAVFDVAKYILEEEVVRERELRQVSEVRQSLDALYGDGPHRCFPRGHRPHLQGGRRRYCTDGLSRALAVCRGRYAVGTGRVSADCCKCGEGRRRAGCARRQKECSPLAASSAVFPRIGNKLPNCGINACLFPCTPISRQRVAIAFARAHGRDTPSC